MKYTEKMEQVNASYVNKCIAEAPGQMVLDAEAGFKKQILNACDFVVKCNCNFVFLAGPSSSGKTTASKMLVEALKGLGKNAIRISLDNFYKDRDDLPLWKNGRKNYESIKGLDLDYFENLLAKLRADNRANFPVFDFTEGRRGEKTFEVTLAPETYLIFEGIHALNPLFEEIVGESCSTKIYISVHSDFMDNEGNVILCGRNLRLIRRILRDNSVRNSTLDVIFDMWEDVLKGERQYIAPYRKCADLHINSTHVYEPNVYKKQLLAVLKQSGISERFEQIRNDLIRDINYFDALEKSYIPKNSLLREFVPSILGE